jgi:hypothetical protein
VIFAVKIGCPAEPPRGSHAALSIERRGSQCDTRDSAYYASGMAKPALVALVVVAMVAVIVTVDVLVFRDQFWERLAANAGIVVLFGAGYAVMRRRSARRA